MLVDTVRGLVGAERFVGLELQPRRLALAPSLGRSSPPFESPLGALDLKTNDELTAEAVFVEADAQRSPQQVVVDLLRTEMLQGDTWRVTGVRRSIAEVDTQLQVVARPPQGGDNSSDDDCFIGARAKRRCGTVGANVGAIDTAAGNADDLLEGLAGLGSTLEDELAYLLELDEFREMAQEMAPEGGEPEGEASDGNVSDSSSSGSEPAAAPLVCVDVVPAGPRRCSVSGMCSRSKQSWMPLVSTWMSSCLCMQHPPATATRRASLARSTCLGAPL